jgi:hypothetical protein
MISIAVAALELGILTISPDTYFALPDGEGVPTVVWVVVFVVPELSVQPAKRTQEIRSTTRPVTRTGFLFIVLSEPGDYFKKSFYPLHIFQYNSTGQNVPAVVPCREKRNRKKTKKQK